MNSSTHNSRIGRIAAASLGLALVGGMSLGAVVPAQAATEVRAVNVDPSTIGAGGEVNADWLVTGTFAAAQGGLELHGQSGVAQSFGFNTLNAPTIEAYAASGDISWTTTPDSAPANLQIMLDARSVESDQDSRLVTLTAVGSAPGENIASLTQGSWMTDASISRDDTDPDADFTAGDTASLEDFLSADGVNSVSGFGLVGSTAGQNSVVTAASWPQSEWGSVFVNDFTFLTPLQPGTVTVSGKAAIGEMLTATVAGWPEGAELSYQWASAQLYNGGTIEGATNNTYKVTAAEAQRFISVAVTGTIDGFAASTVYSEPTAVVPALEKKTAAAPAADSSKLDAYLAEKGVEKQAQTAVGLPEGKLDATKEYTAEVTWTAVDSFVDVYLYSTPTQVGTFPVLDGKAQITLTSDVLSSLEGGSHTLLITGQTSGEVQAAALAVEPAPAVEPAVDVAPAAVETDALADTGSAVTVPLAAAGILLLAGGALAVARRRMAPQS